MATNGGPNPPAPDAGERTPPAWTYLADSDVHRAKVFGRCDVKNGMAPVERLVSDVMNQQPYKTARRVVWIMDNCSVHRGHKAVDRFRATWPYAVLIHTPVHASWVGRTAIPHSYLTHTTT